MVVRETTSLPSPRAVSVPLMAWARLPPRSSKDFDLEVTSEQHVRKFFTGQQDPCVTSPCSGRSRAAEEEEDELKQQQKDLKESLKKGRGTSIHQDKRGGLGDFVPVDRDTDQEMESNVTESEDYNSLVTDSDMHFPPILKSRVKPGEQDPGSSSSPALIRTFAQVVSQDPSGETEAQKNGWEDTVNGPRPEPLSEEGSSGESLGRDPIDKSDGRYISHLEFAIKCGYSESDLDRVISRRGVECDKNLLLQELIRTFSGSNRLETVSPNEESSEEHDPRAMVQEGHPHSVPQEDEGRLVNAEDDCKTVSPGRGEGQTVADGASGDDVEEEEEEDELAEDENKNLRDIIIDGSNVAMSHGKSVFSCRGIQIVVDWFRERGHQNITAFVPQWRKETSRPDFPITDQGLLLKLAAEGVVAFTPARRVKGRRVACYDDRFMLQLAAQTGGVVVSNDNYRDLVKERDEFRVVVEERVLMYTFVNDRFMPPEDPLGRMGPTLDNFLRKQPINEQTNQVPCPYGRKCTFGTKCKYSHPERGAAPHKMVSQLLQEQAARRMQERSARGHHQGTASSGRKTKLARTHSLLHGEHPAAEMCGVVPPSPQVLPEAACIDSRAKSPPHPSQGKTSDYLRVHRQKLEKALAKAALADSTAANEDVESHEARDYSTAVQHKAGLGGASVFPGHMACCSPPPSSDGQLVIGHLLLAKKLSDEASESTFFSQEELTRQQRGVMTSPPMSIHRTDVPPPGHDTCRYRRSSLPDNHHHQQQQQLHHRPPSAPHHTNTSPRSCRSGSAGQSPHLLPAFPYSQGAVPGVESQMMSHPAPDAIALNGGRYVGQYTDSHPGFPKPKSQFLHNNPRSDLFPVLPAAFPSGQLGGGGMDPRDSYPGPQRHTPRAADASYGDPCYPPCPPFVPHSPPDGFLVPPTHRSFPEHAGHISFNQQQGHTPCQMKAARAFQPSHAQTGTAMRSSPGPAMSEGGTGSYHWGGDSMFPNQHVASFPTPQSPHRPPPPSLFQTVSDGDPSRWQLSSPPPPMTPHSGPPVQPGCGDSGLPVEVTDPRHLLYLHLCKTFAQQRVQAVMNKYPDVTDLQTLCVCLLTEL